jgi:hypothetical protein
MTTEQGTRGFVQCSTSTGCGSRWTWNPNADLTLPNREDSWTNEADARAWAETHLTVCDGPIEVVVTHRDGEPV